MQVAVHAVAVFALCVPCASLAQGRVVEGVVVDSAGAPVPYANIIASGSQRRIAAGADGRFRFSLDSSAMRAIDVKRIGFHPRTISLEPWPDSAIRVVLAAASRTLDAVTVAAARSASLAIRGFYDRMNDVERGIKDLHGYGAEQWRVEGAYLVSVPASLADAGVLVEPASVVAKACEPSLRLT